MKKTLQKIAMSGAIAAIAYLGIGCAPTQTTPIAGYYHGIPIQAKVDYDSETGLESIIEYSQNDVRPASRSYIERLISTNFDLQNYTNDRVEYTRLNAQGINRMTEIITNELQKYDISLMPHLRSVRIAERIYRNGRPVGGVNVSGTGTIYLSNMTAELVPLIHSELASVLFDRIVPQSMKDEWNGINPPGFRYGVGAEPILAPETRILEEGFRNRYGKSSMKEDFSQFVRYLFYTPLEMSRYAETHEKFGRKLDLVFEFFDEATEGRMNKDYIINLGRIF